MPDVELERLLVRMDGDSRNYTRMLAEAQTATVQAAAAIGGALTFKGALGAFAEAEGIGLRLNAVLDGNGRDVANLTARYAEFAQQMERVSVLEDDQVLKMLAVAGSFNTFGAQAQTATSNAAALSAALTGSAASAEHYLRFTTALARGDIEGAMHAKRMIPPLREIRDQTELAARAAELFETGTRAMAAETRSFSGQLTILKRDFGNLMEDVGKFVAEAVSPVIKGLTDMVKWFRDLDDGMKRNVTIMAGAVTGFLALGPALKLIGLLGFSVFNPMVIVVGALGFALSVFVERAGGIPQAINEAKASLLGFLEAHREFIKTAGIATTVVAGLVLAFKLLQASGIVSIAQWVLHKVVVVAWTAVVIAAKLAVMAFSAVMVVGQTAIAGVAAVLGGAATAASLLLHGFVLLVNGIGTLVTLSAGLLVMAPVFVAVGAAVYAAYRTVANLATALRSINFDGVASAARRIFGVFREWGGIAGDVGRAMTVSFDLSWRLVEAGGRLALAQIQAMWAPLWSFVRGGFDATWDYVSSMFGTNMRAAIERSIEYLNGATTGAGADPVVMDAIQRRVDAAARTAASALSNGIRTLGNELAVNVTDALEAPAIARARAAVRAVQNELRNTINNRELARLLPEPQFAGVDAMADAFGHATDKVKETKDAINELKASAVGSVDAAAKIAAYLSGATEGNAGPGGSAVGPSGRAAGASSRLGVSQEAAIGTPFSRAGTVNSPSTGPQPGDAAFSPGGNLSPLSFRPSGGLTQAQGETMIQLLRRMAGNGAEGAPQFQLVPVGGGFGGGTN